MKEAVNKRLVDILNYLKKKNKIYNEADFAKKINISKSFLSDMKAGRKEISERTIKAITNQFREISYDWLLSGQGDMIDDGMCYFTGVRQNDNLSTVLVEKTREGASVINQSNINGSNIKNVLDDKTIEFAYASLSLEFLMNHIERLQEEKKQLIRIIHDLEKKIK